MYAGVCVKICIMQPIVLVHPIPKPQNRSGVQVVCLLAGLMCVTTFLTALFASKNSFSAEDRNNWIAASDFPLMSDKQGQSAHTIAYVVSMDSTSARARHTERTLTSVGFRVTFVAPNVHGHTMQDKVWSNKMAFLGVLETFVRKNDTAWLFLFEDDITVHSEITFQSIQEMQSQSPHFVYLGICGTFAQFVVQWWTFQNLAKCGRCAHAMGFSMQGAQEFLAFNHNKHNMYAHVSYFDVVVEAWCLSLGGFPVLHYDLTSPYDRGHHGAFFQDRHRFATTIG